MLNDPLADSMAFLYGFLAVHLPFHWPVGRFGSRGYWHEYAKVPWWKSALGLEL